MQCIKICSINLPTSPVSPPLEYTYHVLDLQMNMRTRNITSSTMRTTGTPTDEPIIIPREESEFGSGVVGLSGMLSSLSSSLSLSVLSSVSSPPLSLSLVNTAMDEAVSNIVQIVPCMAVSSSDIHQYTYIEN